MSTLYVVATPIGNLEDASPRARRVLAEADVILAEDTRVARELFRALGIEPKEVWRLDAHREVETGALDGIIARLASGSKIALVSDAGTPGISDPGARLVDRVHREGYTVVPVPGASALAAFLSAVGTQSARFTFGGFLPRERSKRAAYFREREEATDEGAFVHFESPERIEDTLRLLSETYPDARLAVGKELTKRFERIWVGSTGSVYDAYIALTPPERRGSGFFLFERVKVSAPTRDPAENGENPAENAGVEALYIPTLRALKLAEVRLGDAVRAVCQVFGANRNEAYREALKIFSD